MRCKCWYQLEDYRIRNNVGPSIQRASHMWGQGAPRGCYPTAHTETAVFPEPIALLEQILALKKCGDGVSKYFPLHRTPIRFTLK